MIGTHKVMAYQDRNAAGWGQPLLTNPTFAVDLSGWATAPFSTPWTWQAPGDAYAVMPTPNGGSTLNRTDASVIARPPNVDRYRLRVEVTVDVVSIVWGYVFYGKNQHGAAVGPFWTPNDAKQEWAAQWVNPGTTVVEFVWGQGAAPGSDYPWLGAAVKVSSETPTGTWTARIHSIELHYRSTGASADITCLIDELAIVHGREEPTGQPSASAATIDFTTTPAAPLPALVDIGAVIVVSTTTATGESVRFTGRVTDISLAWDDAGSETPDAGVGQLVAVSLLADLARRVVGDVPWPQEIDGTRVQRIATAAGEPLDPAWSDPGTVQIVPRDVDSQAALDLMHGVADSAGGIVWQTRGSELRYADSEHRRGAAPGLILDACDVLVTPTWMRNLAGLVNDISIGYGVAPEGGEQPRYLATDAASVTKYGRYEYSVATELAALADATAMGQLLMIRNSSPVWVLTALPIDLAGLSAEETDRLLALEMHDLIQVTGMPAIGSAPTAANLWVEGWREKLAHGVHEIEMAVSGFCRTSPPPRWDDLPPNQTWDSMNQTITWNEAVCLGPIPDTGMWDSTPATLRWDAVNPALTWDTY